MNEITVTIKLTPEALEEAAEKLFKMAYGLSVCKDDKSLKPDIDPDLNKARQVFGTSIAEIPPIPPIPGVPPVPVAEIPPVLPSGKKNLAPVFPATPDWPEPKKNLEGVELDATGLPWDVRINSKSSEGEKVKVKSGTWRLKRGADKNLVPVVLAELRAAMNVPEAAPVTPVATPAIPTVPIVPPVPPVPPVPEVSVAAEVSPVDTPQDVTFPQFVQKVTDRSTTQWGPQYTEAVKKILEAKGIAGLPLLMARPDLIPEVDCEAEKIWVQLSVPEIQD